MFPQRANFAPRPTGGATYQIVAWHEGWAVVGKEQAYDVLTERKVERPLFPEPKTWEKSVTVNATSSRRRSISEDKVQQSPQCHISESPILANCDSATSPA